MTARYLGSLLSEHFDDYPKAKHYFDLGLTLAPNDPITHFNLALLLAKHGELAETQKHYERACTLEPTYRTEKDDKHFGIKS